MAKKIKLRLTPDGITDAINEIRAYRAELNRKANELATRIANEVESIALSNFAAAVCDDLVKGGSRPVDVSVSVQDNGGVVLVIAYGTDAVFCEFGAGVYHNGSAGTSPHPKGAELGMTIGSYGKGHGARKVWGYYERDGDPTSLVLTRGTPASMPMYNALKTVSEQISKIAKEVFS